MAKKFLTVVLAAVMMMCLAGCSDYVMTAEDLEKQKSIEGYWAADDSTGYNSYDENGSIVSMIVVEFTEDYKYMLHTCYINEGYVMTYDPVEYSFEDEKFKVMVDGVASYARVSVNEDGRNMRWITDEKTDLYLRVTDEAAAELGIPEYDPEKRNTEATSEGEKGDVSESSEEGTDSGEAEAASLELNGEKVSDELPELDPERKFKVGETADLSVPYVIAEPENSDIIIYGAYGPDAKIFIEHDGVVDTFEQEWLTPRNIEPRFKYGDFDSNGTDELAAIYYVGSGTGVSVEELVFYKLSDGHFKSYVFDPVSYLENVIKTEIDNEANTVTFTHEMNGESVSYDTSEAYPNGIDQIGWGANIGYKFDGSDVILTAYPSVNLSYECMPKITARVSYWDACGVEFGFGDITIEKEF